VKEYAYEQTRPGPYSNGNLDLEFDKDGYIWIGMMNQTASPNSIRKTEKWVHFPIQKEMLDEETQTAMVARSIITSTARSGSTARKKIASAAST
jgi:hypothetical protein